MLAVRLIELNVIGPSGVTNVGVGGACWSNAVVVAGAAGEEARFVL